MPPKSPKGKKKLSKAEKEKLKKEEEERKSIEQEEARRRAELEEAERKEKEKQEQEEKRQLENEERKKRKGQLVELEEIWTSNRHTLHEEQAEMRRKRKWARYMLCDGSPDPTVMGEINTYMSLLMEDVERSDLDSVLEDSDLTLSLLEELESIIEETPGSELTEKEPEQFSQTIQALQNCLKIKLNLASHDLLLRSTDLANSETMNLQHVQENDNMTLCMWGNLSKNPRIKSHEFKEKGFMFDMPKLLSLSDCAFRVLFTKFDHLSLYCKSYMPRIKHKELAPAEEEVVPTEAVQGEEEKAETEEPETVEREETKDVMAELEGLDDEDDEEKKEEPEQQPEEEAEQMEEDYELHTPEPLDCEDFDGDDDEIDMRAYQVIGGIFHFDLLTMPPQPKTVNTWIITQKMEPAELKPLEYVVETTSPSSAQGQATPTGNNKDKDGTPDVKEKKEVERPPICVTMTLPEDVYFCEEPQVARWDERRKHWRLDGFTDHKFKEEERQLSFKTAHFGPMALLQDSHINMPFQSWEVRPRGANHAMLTIIAAIVEVEIQIKNGSCCLSQPSDRPELNHLIDQWMSPQHLVKAMRAAGMNVFPAVDSHKYVSVQNKNAITEERLYQQLALVASTIAFSWSKWNSEVENSEKIVFQGTEHLADEPLQEEDWSLYLVTKKRTTKLKMVEFDETFSDDHAEGSEFHADMYHMTLEQCSDGGADRLRETRHTFVEAIYQMLKSTRLLTYS